MGVQMHKLLFHVGKYSISESNLTKSIIIKNMFLGCLIDIVYSHIHEIIARIY